MEALFRLIACGGRGICHNAYCTSTLGGSGSVRRPLVFREFLDSRELLFIEPGKNCISFNVRVTPGQAAERLSDSSDPSLRDDDVSQLAAPTPGHRVDAITHFV